MDFITYRRSHHSTLVITFIFIHQIHGKLTTSKEEKLLQGGSKKLHISMRDVKLI